MDDILLLTLLILTAGVVAVPVATRLGLGSVLGYLIAGMAISPFLATLDVNVANLQRFAEFGVVMMLFLIGLELRPRKLWEMRHKLIGLGAMQVLLTIALVIAAARMMDQTWSTALAIGLILSISSTAIVLQTLSENGQLKSDGGQSSIAVLLFQDIAVIPMLALIPLLAIPELHDVGQHTVTNTLTASGNQHDTANVFIAELSGWQRGLTTMLAIGVVIIGGHYLIRPIFKFISLAKLRELFTATALLIVIGIDVLMSFVGLSPALGSFLAGVVLANSEYRHELKSDIAPFKGLLLGLFFITVGASINFALLVDDFGTIVLLTLGLIAVKALVLLTLGFLFHIHGADRWLLALGLAQAGEFSFVLLAFALENNAIPESISAQLLLVIALSMLLTPLLFIVITKVITPLFVQQQRKRNDDIDEKGSIIIAGHGRFGGVINRMLLSTGYNTVVLDHHEEHLERMIKFGLKVFYGDATRPDMLESAGIHNATILVIAIDDRDQITEMVRHVAKNYPHIHIIARAVTREHVYEIYGAGAHDIIRDYFDSAVRAGRSALEALGIHPFDAEQQARGFTLNDQHNLRDLANLYDPSIPLHENESYIARAKVLVTEEERAMKAYQSGFGNNQNRDWLPPLNPNGPDSSEPDNHNRNV